MVNNNSTFLCSGFVRRLQAAGSAALVTCAAMAVPVSILLAGFSMGGVFISEVFKPTVALVGTMLLTLLFPLVMMTFDAIRKMEAMVAQVKESIKFDSLTRVLCRSYFLDLLRDSNQDGYILIVDADYFKRINDGYGHGAGDAALVALAHGIEWGAENLGHVGRLGGEEFGVFLPGVSRNVAEKVAEDIRAQVAGRPIYIEGIEINLTVSIGAAPYTSGQPLRASLTPADENLYRAKALGRNKVVFDDEPMVKRHPYKGLRVIR